jgi:hypothetical protein
MYSLTCLYCRLPGWRRQQGTRSASPLIAAARKPADQGHPLVGRRIQPPGSPGEPERYRRGRPRSAFGDRAAWQPWDRITPRNQPGPHPARKYPPHWRGREFNAGPRERCPDLGTLRGLNRVMAKDATIETAVGGRCRLTVGGVAHFGRVARTRVRAAQPVQKRPPTPDRKLAGKSARLPCRRRAMNPGTTALVRAIQARSSTISGPRRSDRPSTD